MQTTLIAPDIECEGCANAIKRAMAAVSGVNRVEVDIAERSVLIDHDPAADRGSLEAALERAGFPVGGSA